MPEYYIDNLYAAIIILVMAALAVALFLFVMFKVVGAYEKRNYEMQVDDLFMLRWDGKPASRLNTWYRVKSELVKRRAITPLIDAADRRIEQCKKSTRRFRTVQLKNGRPVVISNLN